MTQSTRRKSREIAMQMLFQADIGRQTPDQVRATFWKAGDEVELEVRGFAEDLFRVAIAHQEEIDALLVAKIAAPTDEGTDAINKVIIAPNHGGIVGSDLIQFPAAHKRIIAAGGVVEPPRHGGRGGCAG